jgi:hypothetical protein
MNYEDILINSQKVDWYGTQVPKDLLTKEVVVFSEQIQLQIDKYEETLDKKDKQKREYVNNLIIKIQELPYRLNGDFYLIKKKEIENRVVTVKNKVNNSRRTKNSNLIFGNQ